MQPIKSSQALVLVGALIVIVVIMFSFTKVFQATPPAAPEPSRVFSEPHTIAVLFVRQSTLAVDGFKEGLKKLGYTNVTFREVLFDSQVTTQDVEKLTKELLD